MLSHHYGSVLQENALCILDFLPDMLRQFLLDGLDGEIG